jgi:hypothetical protein
MSTIVETVRSLLRLEPQWFRRPVLVGLSISVAIAWLVAAIADEVDASVGVAISLAVLVPLVGVMLDHVASMNPPPQKLQIHERDTSANTEQLTFLRGTQPAEVKLCESTAKSAVPIFRALKESAKLESIHLLVCHPDHLSESQPDDLRVSLRDLERIFPPWDAETKDLQVRCYTHPPSLRGRNYGDLIVAGWYTYELLSGGTTDESPDFYITGEQTPVVVAPVSEPAGGTLRKAFDKAFEGMWSEAVPLGEVLKGWEGRPKLTDEWITTVSVGRRR